MKVLIVPLNWGLGHATRCIPLVRRYLNEGTEVWLGGTGASLRLLHAYFPHLTTIELAPLNIRYSAGNTQVWAMLRAIPQLIRFTKRNHLKIKELVRSTKFDLIISDNCFGVWTDSCDCVYITHQLHICLPKPWRWLEPLAAGCHAILYKRYKEIWVPDYSGTPNLSGILGHPKHLDPRVRYIAPLSRFDTEEDINCQLSTINYSTVALLSGVEPQRTLFERDIMARYADSEEQVLIVRGLTDEPQTTIQHGNITLVSHVNQQLCSTLLSASKHIIARSGYSTIMDLHVLGKRLGKDLLAKAELIPTPGQPEQEYLAKLRTETEKDYAS